MNRHRITFSSMALVLWLISLPAIGFAQSLSVTAYFDGATGGGNPHFYFLPPLAPEHPFSGTFNSSLEPSVDICQIVDGTPHYPPIANFTMGGQGSERVRVAGQQYIVNWNTKGANLDPGSSYQIRVMADGLLMGFATLKGDMRNRTIPIKFRLEEGAKGWGVVGPEGGTLPFADGVVFDIPSGALNTYVAIRVEMLPAVELQALLDARWYRSHEKRALGCFRAEPDGLIFNVPITVRMPVPHLTGFPVQVEVSSDLLRYWIAPTNLVYDPSTNIARFTLSHFSGEAVVEVMADRSRGTCCL